MTSWASPGDVPSEKRRFPCKAALLECVVPTPRSLGFANPSSQDHSTRTSATTGQEQPTEVPGGYISNRITNVSASRCNDSGPTPTVRRLRWLPLGLGGHG